MEIKDLRIQYNGFSFSDPGNGPDYIFQMMTRCCFSASEEFRNSRECKFCMRVFTYLNTEDFNFFEVCIEQTCLARCKYFVSYQSYLLSCNMKLDPEKTIMITNEP